jgi:hypothetical protein
MTDESKNINSSITEVKLKDSITSVNQKVVEELVKAFGDDVAYHIKESGPSWVNSPRSEDLRDLVEHNLQVVVHNVKK